MKPVKISLPNSNHKVFYTIKIKYWNASGSGFPPSLIPALQNIDILHHKKENLPKHLQHNETLKIFCQNVKTLQDLCSSKCTKVHFNPKWEAFLEVQKHHWVFIEIAYQRNVAKYWGPKYWCSKDGRVFRFFSLDT